jgi:LysR family hydrogen peroxide-inducible transcriptional activator
VCHLHGAGERAGFRATSLETLRQMVAGGAGLTLMPELSVRPPVPDYRGVRLLSFSNPAPSRRVGLVWRSTSAFGGFLPRLAEVFRSALDDQPVSLLR